MSASDKEIAYENAKLELIALIENPALDMDTILDTIFDGLVQPYIDECKEATSKVQRAAARFQSPARPLKVAIEMYEILVEGDK